MGTPTGLAARSRALIMKYPGAAIAYRHPRTFASAESVVGIWLVVPGAILIWGGYWWGVASVVGRCPSGVVCQPLQPNRRT
jgi:hypothetical protein